jgi:hypothetical protein
LFTLIVSPSTTTLILESSKAVAEFVYLNLRDFNTTSSSHALLGFNLNSANTLLDLRRTVFLALETTLRDP